MRIKKHAWVYVKDNELDASYDKVTRKCRCAKC